jgi:hypothetical protein
MNDRAQAECTTKPPRVAPTPCLVGGLFELLRQFHIFHSDFAHLPLGIRVLERLGFRGPSSFPAAQHASRTVSVRRSRTC